MTAPRSRPGPTSPTAVSASAWPTPSRSRVPRSSWPGPAPAGAAASTLGASWPARGRRLAAANPPAVRARDGRPGAADLPRRLPRAARAPGLGHGGHHLPGGLVPPGQGGGADGRGDHDVPGRAAGGVARFGPWGLAKLRYGVSTEAFIVVAAAVGWGRQREKTRGRRALPALALRPVERPGYLCPADAEHCARGALFIIAISQAEHPHLSLLGLDHEHLFDTVSRVEGQFLEGLVVGGNDLDDDSSHPE